MGQVEMSETHSASTELEAQIRNQISQHGPLTFAEFMDRALYDRELGYYRTSRNVVGKSGDFFTSVSATPMFGRMLVSAIEQYAERFQPPLAREFHEFGAHRGQLREDILNAAPALSYRVYDHEDSVPTRLEGVVVANELLDALPFHRVKVVDGRWRELFVGADSDRLGWVVGDLSSAELTSPLEGLPLEYMEGYTTEVSLGVRRWLEGLGARLERGLVVLFDYGHETEHYFAPHRTEGGLRTFFRHQRGDEPFVRIGEQDITCDVNFSDVVETAKRTGFEVLEFCDQGRFFSRQVARLLRAGGASDGQTGSAFTPEQVRGLMTLTHPAHLGMAFKVVVLSK